MSMHDMDDQTRQEVLGEALMDELKAIREYVQDIPVMKEDVAELKADVEELKADMKVVKAAVTDQSHQLARHEKILSLKRKTA